MNIPDEHIQKIINFVCQHPGLTTTELLKIAPDDVLFFSESNVFVDTLTWLCKSGRGVERRREPDMRTAAKLKDPVKRALFRMLPDQSYGTAWRYYPKQ